MIEYIQFWLAKMIAEAIVIGFWVVVWIIISLAFIWYIDYKSRQ